jgi:Domain of unknown function (4846)
MPTKTFSLLLIALILSCDNKGKSLKPPKKQSAGNTPLLPQGQTVFRKIEDIPAPEGFYREAADSSSFAFFLRQVALKKDRTVYLYNGTPKQNQAAQFAVLDVSVGSQNLQQCADAVMRLRAEYFYAAGQYDSVLFKDDRGKHYAFTAPYTRPHFDNYLLQVFGMCGSASLSKQLRAVNDFTTIKIGDVLIRGGFPGHAVIVMDVVQNAAGKKKYLIAQSYMPAQDIHVLNNPNDDTGTPWYAAEAGERIITPEYVFYRNELRQW